MKILICDFPHEMERDLNYEKNLLAKGLPEAQIYTQSYDDPEMFCESLRDADVLLTSFVPLDERVLQQASHLKLISVNATGCNTIDLAAAQRHGIHVANVAEYCTDEVADHTLAMMLALNRQLKAYNERTETQRLWSYDPVFPLPRLKGQTLAVFGFGKISQAVVQRARAFGMKCIVVSEHLLYADAERFGIQKVSCEEALAAADVLSNHMKQTKDKNGFFSEIKFRAMKRKPVFLNMGRGEAVDEDALVKALNEGWIAAAGLDVFADEGKNLETSRFFQRDNVILTPHAAFYSAESMRDVQRISCENIIKFFSGERDQIRELLV